jgi:hypothetical protein
MKNNNVIPLGTPSFEEFHLASLHGCSALYVGRARELAKSGRKDEARDWLRFFRNCSVVEICARTEHIDVESKRHFREQLRLLERECHPLDEPDYRTDLMAIRAQLETILEQLGVRPGTVVKMSVG